MSNEEIRKKVLAGIVLFDLDDLFARVDTIQNETRKDERAAVIEEIEKEKHNLKPKYAIRQIDIWVMEQTAKLRIKK